MIASQEVAIRGPVAAGATLHLNVGSDDAVTVSGANLDVQSAALGDDEGEPYIADLYIRIPLGRQDHL